MKKIIIAALLVVGMTTFAQEKKERPKRAHMERMNPEQHQEKQLKRMTSELGLNEKQQEQIKQVLAEQWTKRAAHIEDMKKQREALRDQMQEERKKMLDEMKSILTPDQFEKWKTNQEKMREKMGDRMRKRMGHKMKDRMKN